MLSLKPQNNNNNINTNMFPSLGQVKTKRIVKAPRPCQSSVEFLETKGAFQIGLVNFHGENNGSQFNNEEDKENSHTPQSSCRFLQVVEKTYKNIPTLALVLSIRGAEIEPQGLPKCCKKGLDLLKKAVFPVLAGVDGKIVEYETVSGCDIIVAKENTVFKTKPGRNGFKGNFILAERALQSRLLNELVPSDQSALERTLDLCNEMVSICAPLSISAAKGSMNEGYPLDEMDQALDVEGKYYDSLIPSEDRLEGLASYREKRKPRYQGK